jgi:hypothetical protein
MALNYGLGDPHHLAAAGSREVTAPTSLTSISRAITASPKPTTTCASNSRKISFLVGGKTCSRRPSSSGLAPEVVSSGTGMTTPNRPSGGGSGHATGRVLMNLDRDEPWEF